MITPGPWQAVGRYLVRSQFSMGDGDNKGWLIAELPAHAREGDSSVIAASLDYHDAAVKIVAAHDEEAKRANFNRCGCDTCTALRPIIVKATGAQP